MKTIEYPIYRMVSIEMDENKIWWLGYNTKHECFPQREKKVKTKYGDEWKRNMKGYRDFVRSVSQFCEEQNFTLEGEGFGMVGRYLRELVSFTQKDFVCYSFPHLLFPKPPGCGFGWNMDYDGNPLPYYGNPHYKKYIEDNNGECPLPLPKVIQN